MGNDLRLGRLLAAIILIAMTSSVQACDKGMAAASYGGYGKVAQFGNSFKLAAANRKGSNKGAMMAGGSTKGSLPISRVEKSLIDSDSFDKPILNGSQARKSSYSKKTRGR